MKRFTALTFAVIFAIAACSSGSDEATSTPTAISETPSVGSTPPAVTDPVATTTTAAPTPISTPPPSQSTRTATAPSAIQTSSQWVETEPTTFRVQFPGNTPSDEPVYLTILNVDNIRFVEHVEMTQIGDQLYEATVDLGIGAQVRYTFDRWDGEGCCAVTHITRESLFTGEHVRYRLALREPGMDLFEDVVPQWNDLEFQYDRATVTGRVVDAATGDPIMDADVSVGGLHVATRFDGSFEVEGLAPGPHRAVAYTVDGEYLAGQVEFNLTAAGVDGIELALNRTQMRTVRFTIHVPDETPEDASVRIIGNMRQLGARHAGVHQPERPSSVSTPSLPIVDGVATGEFELPEGAYIEYAYLLGSQSTPETVNHDRLFRSFFVDQTSSERVDEVVQWANEGWPLVTVRLKVPKNTPVGVPVYFVMGPSDPMTQVGPYEYVTVVGSMPPGTETQFRFNIGDDMQGADGSVEADENGMRTLLIPDESSDVLFEIDKWKHLPDPEARNEDRSLDVIFRLSLPPDAPSDARIALFGNRPAINSGGTPLEPVNGNPWLHEASVRFGHDGALSYSYRVEGTGEVLGSFTIGTDYDGQIVNNYVADWDGSAPAKRDDWISGIYMPDFWSESFIPTSESTFNSARESNGEWVAISSVWSFGQIHPYPTIESRPHRIWSVLTPLEDIKEQAEIARDSGMKIFLAPQMNPEVHPGWQDATVSARSTEWWERWLEEAEAQWMWNAIVGEQIGAEMLMLPGYVFHVYPPPGFFDDPDYPPVFDIAVQGLIGKVRDVYSGKIMISGSQTEYDFPGLADYVGVTTYDIGVPDELPADASFDEMVAHYEPRFDEKVDGIWEKWGKPVMFYTIHAPSKAQVSDPYGQLFQANAYEAMYQLIAERPYVAGSFTWAYSMNGASDHLSDGVRGRTAEAVMAKWYEILGGAR